MVGGRGKVLNSQGRGRGEGTSWKERFPFIWKEKRKRAIATCMGKKEWRRELAKKEGPGERRKKAAGGKRSKRFSRKNSTPGGKEHLTKGDKKNNRR